MDFNLFVNYYNDKVQARTDELNFCLLQNLKNPKFDKIVVICTQRDLIKLHTFVLSNESNGAKRGMLTISSEGALWKKIIPVVLDFRPSFNDYFETINQLFPTSDSINIVSNLDIIIPEFTLVQAECYISPNKCLALTRYDSKSKENYIGDSKYLNNPDSQDTWIFNGAVKEISEANFPLGTAGTDNKIAYLLDKEGYEVSNPSLTLKTFHIHLSDIRNYSVRDEDRLQPPFLILHPTS